MNLFLLLPLVAFVALAIGVLIGSGQVTHAQEMRGRHQAAVQEEINNQRRALGEIRKVIKQEMRQLGHARGRP